MNRPLCFVLMPFGKKPNASGSLVDFDAVYQELIKPAIEEADLEPLRADEEMTGGIIHKPMFERLILCDYAVADLTTANANVFYELGIRHAVRDWSTVMIFAEGGGQLPFDVAPLRAIPYKLTSHGTPDEVASISVVIVNRLAAGEPDYWDHATRLELAVLGKNEQQAMDAASAALAVLRESWEAETTARNLNFIQEARQKRNEPIPWVNEILKELERKVQA